MDIRAWDERYRSGELSAESPTPLLAETAGALFPGNALDLACGTGRNALWLAEHGWNVTAVDGSTTAIQILRGNAEQRGLQIATHIADLERGEFEIVESRWDLIAICYYLQRDLLEPAKRGLKPGGVLIVIVHIAEPGEEPTAHRLRPGELRRYFEGWEILHDYEGKPADPAHRRSSAEIVARRP
ncbi:MAG TPA: methyltransferase domain-containing protein [Bryobacteraceae bacterium]|nr:methyltransferase domain-containing protein [Bryobacteraceae bacterium]